jgi:hypothetical protein
MHNAIRNLKESPYSIKEIVVRDSRYASAELLLQPLVSALERVREIQRPLDENRAKNQALEAEEAELLGELDARIRASKSSPLIGSKLDALLPTARLISLRPHIETMLSEKYAPAKLDEDAIAREITRNADNLLGAP